MRAARWRRSVIKAFQLAALKLHAKGILNSARHGVVVLCGEGECIAGFGSTACAPDTMRVCIDSVRHIEVNDM